MDLPGDGCILLGENQAGERVGVENYPGSDDSGRQCRPHKGVVGDVIWKNDCGLGLKMWGMCCGLDAGKCGL